MIESAGIVYCAGIPPPIVYIWFTKELGTEYVKEVAIEHCWATTDVLINEMIEVEASTLNMELEED